MLTALTGGRFSQTVTTGPSTSTSRNWKSMRPAVVSGCGAGVRPGDRIESAGGELGEQRPRERGEAAPVDLLACQQRNLLLGQQQDALGDLVARHPPAQPLTQRLGERV